MSFSPHSRRFDPRWLSSANETNGEGTSDSRDTSPFSSDEESSNAPPGWHFDEVLEQLASERFCVCPLCGMIVARGGTVAS
jgi:hypothetical protein